MPLHNTTFEWNTSNFDLVSQLINLCPAEEHLTSGLRHPQPVRPCARFSWPHFAPYKGWIQLDPFIDCLELSEEAVKHHTLYYLPN